VLGTLRGIREECGLEAHEVAAAIVAAVEDGGAPFRSVLADPARAVALEATGDGERHDGSAGCSTCRRRRRRAAAMSDHAGATPLGREAEVAAIGGSSPGRGRRERGARLIGSAGTGKTTLLREAEALAARSDTGVRVLRARGIESEAELAFGGLLELVRPLADLLPGLPGPQLRALEGALALAPAGTDRFSVSAATLGSSVSPPPTPPSSSRSTISTGSTPVGTGDLVRGATPVARGHRDAAHRAAGGHGARDLEGIDRVVVTPLGGENPPTSPGASPAVG